MKRKEDRFEWIDPITHISHSCPKRFMNVVEHLRDGKDRPRKAAQLLYLMEEDNTRKNQRHLRKAVQILRWIHPKIILAVRSTKGGYYFATENDEDGVKEYADSQRVLGRSMIEGGDSVERRWYKKYRGRKG
jgi:hypothetical protein